MEDLGRVGVGSEFGWLKEEEEMHRGDLKIIKGKRSVSKKKNKGRAGASQGWQSKDF